MNNLRHGTAHRLLAVFLALVLVLGTVPVYAATPEHPDGVTISVVDQNGAPVSGASVGYTINSSESNGVYSSGTELTDEHGAVVVLPAAEFVVDDLTISASISKADYVAAYVSATSISSASQNFSVVLAEVLPEVNTIEDVTITAASREYDGVNQPLVSVVAQEGDVVTYQLEGGSVSSTAPTAKDIGTYSVTVTVSREGYEDLVETVTAVISPAALPIDITAVDLTYNGEAQNLVALTGELLESDTVAWEVDGEALEGRDIPAAENAGTYEVKLTVFRNANYTTFSKTVPVTIAQADIPGVKMSGKGVLYYDGSEQELVALEGVVDSDELVWTVDGDDTGSEDIPTRLALGTYTVTLRVKRDNPNFKTYEDSATVVIDKGTLNLDGLTVEGLESIYTGLEQEAVEVTPDSGYDYTLMYQLDDGDLTVDEDAWANTIPTVIDAGSYVVWVKAVKESYNESNVTVIPAASAVAPYNVYIAQAQQTIEFVESNPTEDTISGEKTYNFAATDVYGYVGEAIVYSLGEGTDEGIAFIDAATGKLTVTDAGTVVVVATLPGSKNYGAVSLPHTMNISEEASADHKLVYFTTDNVSYTFGENNGVVSTNSASKRYNNDNYPTYSINKTDIGLSINKSSGKITITDYAKLGESLIEGNGTVTLTVTADKAAKRGGWGGTSYAADSDTYTLIISFLETPAETVSVSGTKGLIGDEETGWYVSAITVSPVDGTAYTIADSCVPSDFDDSVDFDNQGTGVRYVHLMNRDGGITNRIAVNEKVDTQKPNASNMSVSFSDLTIIQKIGKLFGFYNPAVTVTFTVEDETGTNESGVHHIDWTYTKDVNATSSILASKGGELPVELVDGKYVATLILTASEAEQLRGNVSFTATDKAGNTSPTKTDTTIVVVDTVSPKMNVSYQVTDAENGKHITESENGVNHHFFNGDVKFVITITEANFFEDDLKLDISKDGQSYSLEGEVEWEHNDEEHTRAFTLSGDGNYIVKASYTDNSNNTVESEYVSDVITIDGTAPVVDFEFVREKVDEVDVQKIIFKVTEHNFRASGITVTGTMLDITGKVIGITPEALTTELQSAEWKQDGDVWTYEKTDLVNGIFDIDIDYTDIANNSAVRKSPDTYIIDHSAPTDVKIEIITEPIDKVVRALTLGFYNPDVTIRFTAYDDTAGVESFTWNYTKQNGASNVNRDTDAAPSTIAAVRDSENKSLYTATITLPNTDAKQLRGYLAVCATDAYGNESEKTTMGEVVIVDTIAPEVSVTYAPAEENVNCNRVVEDDVIQAEYYNGDVAVTITVTEANFFADDVVVKVSKNGAGATAVVPAWSESDESVDKHIGTLTLTGDGHYIITVNYTDRSGNQTSTYTSHEITIDTVKPVIEVNYENSNPVNTLRDSEGNNRNYFANKQTAVITITEHNFDSSEVAFTIVAKDVTGRELSVDELHSKEEWTVDTTGDVHKIIITYPGDANYTFDVAYTDLANNSADEYEPDYFTVDTTDPEYVSVEYSTSKLETVLETISFGFYDAKMTVTLTARDDISGIHSFMYSYLIANGVSSVNAGAADQIIEAANITYSDDGATATAKFEIPKAALGNNNQFNGTVEFYATDRAGNTPDNAHKETKRIVVDNIAPTAQVAYNTPTNTEDNISYYDGPINATITVNEANFYASDVRVTVSRDGGAATAVTPAWTDNSLDVHTGTFTLTEDGDYTVSITYADKSTNQMVPYTSNQLTIDTVIEKPVIQINDEDGDGKAYKDDVVPSISFEDVNFDGYEVTLTRTSLGSKNVDVTEKFIGNAVVLNEDGGIGVFDTFEKLAENDGIYKLTVSMTDKVGHRSESSITFTVNRFGSVYEYGDYLTSLVVNGGAYIQSTDEDLVIVEYNADKLVADSLIIEITRDGKPLDNVIYTATPEINDKVGIGESGWYQYTYVISKDNFTSDGVYKISISSKDATGNNTENNNHEGMGIAFVVDSTLPEITSVVGLEDAIINATEQLVRYTVYDTMGIKSIKVYVDGELLAEITDFSADLNNFSGDFMLYEKSSAQNVRIVVEDLAGNTTDTDAEVFSSAYEFNKSVTVSTNLFVRWYANKPLFWGSIGGVVVLAAGLWFFLAAKRKKEGVAVK